MAASLPCEWFTQDHLEHTREIVVGVVADAEEAAASPAGSYADVGAEPLSEGIFDATHVRGWHLLRSSSARSIGGREN